MGAYSTLNITESDAKALIYQSIHKMKDDELVHVLDVLFREKCLYNFNIVYEYKDDGYANYQQGMLID